MRVADVVQHTLDRGLNQYASLTVGRVVGYDPVARTVEVIVYTPDQGQRRYGAVPCLSAGKGSRLSAPRENQMVALGFADGNNAVPVLLAYLSTPPIAPEPIPEESRSHWPGRLALRALL